MRVKTKKYALPKKKYIKLAYVGLLRKQGKWIIPAYVLLNMGIFVWFSWWWAIGSSILLVLYMLFWLLQFVGITYLAQFKILFDKLSYEIDSREVMIKLNVREGMPIAWHKIKRAQIKENAFIFYLSIAQLIYLPFKVFSSHHEIKVIETLLRRKKYIE